MEEDKGYYKILKMLNDYKMNKASSKIYEDKANECKSQIEQY